MSEGPTVTGMQGDSRISFERFVSDRQLPLLRTAYLMTGDHHRAEDLLQGALAKLAMRWERFQDGNGHPEAYVRRVLYRDSVSWWRKYGADLVGPGRERASEPDATDTVDDRLELQTALGRLTAKQRAVVVLRYYEDRSEADTADLLGVSVGTVKSQAHMALRRLRLDIAALAEHDPERSVHDPKRK